MVYRTVFALIAVVLTGCAVQQPLIVTKEVPVPVVAPCPEPPLFQSHPLPVNTLAKGDALKDSAKVWGAAAESIRILEAEVMERDEALEAYRHHGSGQ